MKSIIIFFGIFLIILIAYSYGLRFSVSNLLVKNISVEKAGNIKCGFWKNSSNVKCLGDVIVIGKETVFKTDTLYINNKPKAVLSKLIYRYFSNDYLLKLKSLDNSEIGCYICK